MKNRHHKMFTGIVEHIGTVSEFKQLDSSQSGGNGASLTISNVGPILDDVNMGDSIAVNGVCLTVTEYDDDKTYFKAGLAPETLRRTNLGQLKSDSPVNLERAISGHVRFGGHFVQGHVDGTAEIVVKNPDGNSIAFTFKPKDQSLMTYIVEKGFIAVDGTSLTVTAVTEDTFSIMMVAYTQEKVVLAKKEVGDFVNVEVDFMGKLLEKQIDGAVEKKLGGLEALIEKIVDKKLKQ